MKEPSSRQRQILITFGVLLLFFLVIRAGWLDPVSGFVLKGASPIVRGAGAVASGAKDAFTSFINVGKLGRQVRILEEENARLKASIARTENLKRENEQLRKQLELLPKEKFKLVNANVIAHSTDGVRESLLIDKGRKSGIENDMPVIVYDGIVVGKIKEANLHTSSIVLVSEPDFKVAAQTSRTGTSGLVQGVKGININFIQVPRNKELKEGDQVVTSGVDNVFPPGLLVGVVRSVEAPENEIFQSARLEPIVNTRRVRFVSVITNSLQ